MASVSSASECEGAEEDLSSVPSRQSSCSALMYYHGLSVTPKRRFWFDYMYGGPEGDSDQEVSSEDFSESWDESSTDVETESDLN